MGKMGNPFVMLITIYIINAHCKSFIEIYRRVLNIKRKDPKDISATFGGTARIWHCQILNLGFLYKKTTFSPRSLKCISLYGTFFSIAFAMVLSLIFSERMQSYLHAYSRTILPEESNMPNPFL